VPIPSHAFKAKVIVCGEMTFLYAIHVTVGVIMLTVILYRIQKGHFTADNHFGFEGVAWYWHFVDVVWLGLFIFVYWL
jgi:cytochrome c oxidase subunit 3